DRFFLWAEFDHDLKILVLRVDFITDSYGGTTGNGKFLLSNQVSDCGNYTVDPPPHDKSYFESQFIALDSYFRSVSNGQFGIDLENSDIFPSDPESAYTMPDSMSYYHPFIGDLSQEERDALYEERIVELFSDAITTAYQSDNIIFNQYDMVVVFHAGVSQDFAFSFDTTPEDIPSTFIDYQIIQEYIGNDGIAAGDSYIKGGIILPETQNHLLYTEMINDFRERGIQNICNYQFGLTGTFAMLVGQAIGLPPLWNTDTGESGIGVFGLMDQGSNNGQGLIPASPMAWNRVFFGWEEPEKIIPDDIVEIESRPAGKTLKVNIDDDEYFLIENRTNWFKSNVDIDSVRRAIYNKTDTIPNIIEIIFDSIGVVRDENGVVVSVPDYDIGLPGSGLLIWHIDESIISNNIQFNSINNDPKFKGIDLEEAGGAQDIGYVSTALFRDPSIGEPFDMWYRGNPEYDEVNSNTKGNPIEFNSMTYPNTNSNAGALSNLNIGNIGYASDKMQITISNDLTLSGFPDTSLHILYHTDFTGDGNNLLIGGRNKLWWSNTDKIERKYFYESPSEKNHFVLTNIQFEKSFVVLSDLGDSLKMSWFIFDNGFILDKEEMLYDNWELIPFLTGQDKGNQVITSYDPSYIFIKNGNSDSSISVNIARDSGIIIGDQPLALSEIEFKYISAIDLDLDGTIEVLATDTDGKLYAFNQNYTYSTGFPVDEVAIPPILAKNILGDKKPEIIFQNSDGEIIILNNVGELQYKLTNYKNSRLRMLGEYNDRNTIVTESTIWLFDEVKPTNGNEWSMYYSDEINSNMIEIDYVNEQTSGNGLIDKKRTYVYPNPVRDGKAKIRVFNYSADKIDLKIYDAAGFFINHELHELHKKNEIFEMVWDVSGIESGVYLIKLTATNQNSEESTI
ncbi:T9SS type A sorting domain-containing protein, partial [bacterium]|nr:T9SS type A sorting domain-containing protein [bacterium]